jgi:hypothetical protein
LKILLTGANGFLGKTIRSVLNTNDIITLSRSNSILNYDLSNSTPLIDTHIDLVIHAAGKAHSNPISNDEILNFQMYLEELKNKLIVVIESDALSWENIGTITIDSVEYYSIKTCLLLRDDSTSEQGGSEMTITIDYSNYKKVGAYTLPFVVTQTVGEQEFSMNMTDIKINEGVTEADFNQ